MKKMLFYLVSMAGVISSYAQTSVPVPNHSFENWSVINGIEVPNFWKVRDSSTVKSTDDYTGTYAAEIHNILTKNDTVNGTLSSNPPGGSKGWQPAFPVFVRHGTLNGFYFFSPENGDSCLFVVQLYKQGYVNANSNNVLGMGWIYKGAAPPYAPFTIDITYFDNTAIPDSAFISINAYKAYDFNNGIELEPRGNSVLTIDDISFDGFVLGTNSIPLLAKNASIYPNPSSDFINLDIYLEESIYDINVYDLSGKIIKPIAVNKKLSGQQKIFIDVEDVPQGNYMLLLSNDKGYFCEQISIMR